MVQLHGKTVQLDDESADFQELYFFLSSTDQFVGELKSQLDKQVQQYDIFMVGVIHSLVDLSDVGEWTMPETKYTILKVSFDPLEPIHPPAFSKFLTSLKINSQALALLITLVDIPLQKADEKMRKKLEKRSDKIMKLLKSNPIVPLFGDMPMKLHNVYGKVKHLGAEFREDGIHEMRARIVELPALAASVLKEYQEYEKTWVMKTAMVGAFLSQPPLTFITKHYPVHSRSKTTIDHSPRNKTPKCTSFYSRAYSTFQNGP